jgi:hypothetical protein
VVGGAGVEAGRRDPSPLNGGRSSENARGDACGEPDDASSVVAGTREASTLPGAMVAERCASVVDERPLLVRSEPVVGDEAASPCVLGEPVDPSLVSSGLRVPVVSRLPPDVVPRGADAS